MTILYCARWVLPISSPPIENAAVAVEESRIIAVGPIAELTGRFPGASLQDFGEAAILPGLINCHSHLELTIMRGYLEDVEGDFPAWLMKLTRARLERLTLDDLRVSSTWGAAEAARAGVTCLCDAGDAANGTVHALLDVGLRGIVYQESFGPDPQLARQNFELLRDKVAMLRQDETSLVRVGVSPHAPYSVSGPQLELIAEFALAESLPVMMHAAESEAETLLMLHGVGQFAERLAHRGIEWRAPGISTVQYLSRLGLLRTRPLLAHCIRVDEADMETIKDSGASIAHCPKSNAKLGHGHAPFAEFIEKNLKAGLGSDSVASNNTCDLLEEARFAALMARAFNAGTGPESLLSPHDVLAAATLGGARALNLDAQIGRLAEGLQADLIVVALNRTHQMPVYDPVRTLVFASSGRDVLLTLVAGREVYRDGQVLTVDEQRLRARIEEIAGKLNQS